MERFEPLEIEIISFDTKDIITTSNPTETPSQPIGGNG